MKEMPSHVRLYMVELTIWIIQVCIHRGIVYFGYMEWDSEISMNWTLFSITLFFVFAIFFVINAVEYRNKKEKMGGGE